MSDVLAYPAVRSWAESCRVTATIAAVWWSPYDNDASWVTAGSSPGSEAPPPSAPTSGTNAALAQGSYLGSESRPGAAVARLPPVAFISRYRSPWGGDA